ncbi:MAG: metallophosphoesterase [Selenomonadaceae bacterium]|nr:metallophosphoesterase [Selenomonadaceae bacterium]
MSDEKFFLDGVEGIIPKVNDTPYKRILAIGDVHGQFAKLQSLLKKVSITEDDLVIALGDYIDRGDGVADVLKWVMENKDKSNYIFLRGNHEQMMLDALKSNGADRITWIINGGKATIFALRELNSKKIIPFNDILNFVENLPHAYSIKIGGRNYFFCHAGVDSAKPLDKQDDYFLLWSRSEFFNTYDGEDVIISGHSPIRYYFDYDANNPRPLKIPGKNIIMVDTGAYTRGGRLSCVDIISGQYYQSNDDLPGDIIFVCSGNTCRSPMAKYIMRHLLAKAGLKELSVDSAGCNSNGGSFMSIGTFDELVNNNIPFQAHVSKPFTKREYENFKRVIALDSNVFKSVKEISKGDPDNKIRRLEVEDPWITGDYHKAYEEIFKGCAALLNELTEETSCIE